METKENNKLIAEFMNIEKDPEEALWFKIDGWNYYHPKEKDYFTFPFHRRWDWLMPVVEKISDKVNSEEGLFGKYDHPLEEDAYEQFEYDIMEFSIASTIEEIYQGVVKFIKWYNKNKLNK